MTAFPHDKSERKAVASRRSCIIHANTSVPANTSTSSSQGFSAPQPRRHFLCVALGVAAVANALIPIVFFSETHLFGETNFHQRALVAGVVVAEYAIALLLLLLHANVGFASGYGVATAAIVTLGSAGLAYLIVAPAGWGWSALYAEIFILGWFAFAVLSNFVFLVASIHYARAIHPRLHLGGFFLGLVASLFLSYLYTLILP